MEKLKQKMASHSSRVIASLQQAATLGGNTFHTQQQQQQQTSGSSSAAAASTSSKQQQQQQNPSSASFQVVSNQRSHQQQHQLQQQQQQQQSSARLMAEDATAHLTQEERQILLKVFKKEEQFQRDTIKQMGASRAFQQAAKQQQPQQKQQEYYTHTSSQQQRALKDITNNSGGQTGDQSQNFHANQQPQTRPFNQATHQQHQQSAQLACDDSTTRAGQHQSRATVPAVTELGAAASSFSNSVAGQYSDSACAGSYSSYSPSLFSASRASCYTTTATIGGGASTAGSTVSATSSYNMVGGGTRSTTPLTSSRTCSAAGSLQLTANPSASSSATPITQRATSTSMSNATSSSTITALGPASAPQPPPANNCRICRKVIQATETCHLCSTCGQFICEDCASYSANEKHWMCSSCRRRATKPAIPADALKELGLSQNSSAVRRMTQRLNKNELQMALNSNAAKALVAAAATTNNSNNNRAQPLQAHLQSVAQKNNNNNNSSLSNSNVDHSSSSSSPSSINLQQQQQLLRRKSSTTQVLKQLHQHQQQQQNMMRQHSNAAAEELPSSAAGAGRNQQQLYSDMNNSTESASNNKQIPSQQQASSTGGVANEQRQFQQHGPTQPVSSRKGSGNASSVGVAVLVPSSGGNSIGDQQQKTTVSQTPAQTDRSAFDSGSVPVRTVGGTNMYGNTTTAGQYNHDNSVSGQQYQQQQQQMQRKQSLAAAFLQQQQGSLDAFSGGGGQQSRHAPLYTNDRQQQQYVGGGQHSYGAVMGQQQHATYTVQQHASNQSINEVAAAAAGYHSRRTSHAYVGGGLIPIPADQMHLRRLSDQSNLVRRSSIIADNMAGLEGLAALARNRSHSNIDSMDYSTLLYQQQQQQQQQNHQYQSYSGYAYDNNQQQQQQQQQQKLAHDQPDYQMQQPVSTQLGVSGGTGTSAVVGSQQLSSIITPYAQKSSSSSVNPAQPAGAQAMNSTTTTNPGHMSMSQFGRMESNDDIGIRSDSSSDIDEDQVGVPDLVGDLNYDELDNDQPNEYFAPPRAFNNHNQLVGGNEYSDTQQQYNPAFVGHAHQNGVGIPSVSISEFRSSQQRLHLQQQQQQQQQQLQLDPYYQDQVDQTIIRTPMQINVATEEAILKQQQRNSVGTINQAEFQSLLLSAGLQPGVLRRGSSGRVLPRVPGEQSRSLLELPRNGSISGASGGNSSSPNNGGHAGGGSRSGHASQNGSQIGFNTMLDLPNQNATVRRASAPEGQNIKIVVDDIGDNGCMLSGLMRNGAGGGVGVVNHMGVSSNLMNGTVKVPVMMNRSLGFNGVVGGGVGNGRQFSAGTGELLERLVLYRDDTLDSNTSMAHGFGLHVSGGKIDAQSEKLQAYVSWTLPGGPADKAGIKCGDQIVEWDGKSLVNMTYEQVTDVIESSANIAELLIKPLQRLEMEPGAKYVRSGRRMSQQTERDLCQQREGVLAAAAAAVATTQHQQQQQQQQLLTTNNFSGRLSLSQQNAVSAGNSPKLSRGTGRRLPQIPGGGGLLQPMDGNSTNHHAGHRQSFSSSTGQLEQQHTTGFAVTAGGDPYLTEAGGGVLSGATRSSIMLHAGGGSSSHILNPTPDGTLGGASGANSNSTSVLPSGGGQLTNGNAGAATNRWQHQQQQHRYSIAPIDHHNEQQQQQPQHFQAHAPRSADNNQLSNYLNQSLGVGRALNPLDEIWGLIGLQVNVDERMSQLEISVLSAINGKLDTTLDYYVRVRILPESSRFKAFKTSPSSDLNWKETFLFQNFPVQQLQKMALEVGIWVYEEGGGARLTTQLAQPVCEAMISIQSARERNTDFWPLRAPPSSPQSRRKSLNDLIETHSGGRNGPNNLSIEGHQTPLIGSGGNNNTNGSQQFQWTNNNSNMLSAAHIPQQHTSLSAENSYSFAHTSAAATAAASPVHHKQQQRERSSSNRNLPDANRIRSMAAAAAAANGERPLRRASDELAGSSSGRLLTRISPAPSRRSISVMNVGGGGGAEGGGQQPGSRPRSRMGSQSNILKMRRDSAQAAAAAAAAAATQQASSQSGAMAPVGSPVSKQFAGGSNVNNPASNHDTTGSTMAATAATTTTSSSSPSPTTAANATANQSHEQASGSMAASAGPQPQVGVTPAGRRSSLVGIQSMLGYRAQRTSNSNPQSHSSGEQQQQQQQKSHQHQTVSSSTTPPRHTSSRTVTPQQSMTNLMSTATTTTSSTSQQHQQHRSSIGGAAAGSQVSSSCVSSNAGSRRSSIEQQQQQMGHQHAHHQHAGQLQRKGSFAMMTLRKLRRTMSLNKGTTDGQQNQQAADQQQQWGADSNTNSRQSSFSSTDSEQLDLPTDLGIARRIMGFQEFVGKLKLSFIMTKGQLEIDVICARELRIAGDLAENPIGVYVKIYLKGMKNNKSNKRKTRIVQQTTPGELAIFKQVIKYDASLADNKSLEVSVWQKQGSLKGKIPVGFTEIKLTELSLNQLQISWYNLRSMDSCVCSSSIED